MKIALWQRRAVGTLIMATALVIELAACGRGTVTTSGGTPGGGRSPIGSPGTGGGAVFYTIGGTISAVSGTVGALVLANSSDTLNIPASATPINFVFGSSVANGATYNVTVASQPAGQTCTVTAGTGAVSGANVTNVVVGC